MTPTMFAIALFAGLVSALITGVVLRVSLRRQLVDVPNARSSHTVPTPSMGGIGLAVVVIGGKGTHLGASQYLADVLGREDGAPPPVDLAAERRNGDLVRQLIGGARVTGVHDISSGGIGVALAEMAMTGGIGATVKLEGAAHAALFGEDQGRYVVTLAANKLDALLADAADQGIPADHIGATGGKDLTVEGILTISIAKLKEAHENWFPDYMAAS